jgi:hypothetical protein
LNPKTVGASAGKKYAATNDKFTQLFTDLNKHVKQANAAKSGRTPAIDQAVGAIKSYALGLPKGQIDLGHLGKLREGHEEVEYNNTNYAGQPFVHTRRPVGHSDIEEIINHHVGDAPDLKHIHDHNGGVDAIETLAQTMGANGDPSDYTGFKFKNPQVHADILDLVRPGHHHHNGNGYRTSTYENTDNDPNLDQDVDDTWNGRSSGDKHEVKAHNEAVMRRAVDRFKRHHNIP